MDPEGATELNVEESNKQAEKPAYKEYKQWLKSNGVLVDPALLYPAFFGKPKSGVVGVASIKPIPSGQAIIAVPYDLIITVPKVRQDAQLKKIIEENPSIFNFNSEAAFSVLILFVCRELILGKKSFYAPYFAIAENISLVNWTHWDMLAV